MATVQISVSDTSISAGESCLLTFNFSDTVNGFDQSDVLIHSLSGPIAGTLSNFSIVNSSTYQMVFSPSANFEGAAYFEVPFNSYNVGGLDPGEEGFSPTISIDSKHPTASISVLDTNIQYRESTTVTVAFSEHVTGFDWSDLSGPIGSFSNTTVSTDGRTYTATYYPGDGNDYTLNPAHLSLAAGSYSDDAGNAGMAAISNAFAVDTIDENVSVYPLTDHVLTQGETLLIQVAFATPQISFDPADVVIPSGYASLSSWTLLLEDSGMNAGLIGGAYAYLTPFANVTSADNHVLVRGVSSGSFSIDTLAPAINAISMSDSNLTVGESALVTVNFSEAVSGFGMADIDLSAAAGSVSNFVQINPTTFQMTFVPAANTADPTNLISVLNNSYTDIHGNAGSGASSSNFTINTVPPDVIPPQPVISLSTATVNASGVDITVLFGEPVLNFTLDDVGVAGVPGVFTSFVPQSGGLEYSMHFIPAPDWEWQTNQFVVYTGAYTDAAGNPGLAGASANFTVDAFAPAGMAFPLADSTLSAGEELAVTLQFSEAITGLDVSDFDTSAAAVHLMTLTDQGGGTYTVTFLPNLGIVQAVNPITIGAGQYTDLAGNPGSGITLPPFSVDTVAPTVGMSLSDMVLTAGQSLMLTMNFSEPVVGFDINDIDASAAAGTLGDLIFDGGSTYHVEFTPAPNTTSPYNVIGISGNYTDAAGNAGTAQVAGPFDIDTQVPSLSIGLSDAALTIGESQTLTLSFSERVAGFTASDILLDGSAVSLTGFTAASDGKTFTATYAPGNGLLDATNSFSVAAGSYTDLLGNAGAGATSSNFSIDTSQPAAIYGTAGNDTLIGTAGNDRLCGVPATGTAIGKGSVDRLTGAGGADNFYLADARGVFYDDGSIKTNGTKDYAWITDFSRSQGDKLVVDGGTYLFAATAIGKTSGAGVYLDTNGNHLFDSKDEMVAFIAGVPAGSMLASDLVHF